jgi:hypothetical protein
MAMHPGHFDEPELDREVFPSQFTGGLHVRGPF